MNNTVSPVITENEMRDFWSRLSTMVVGHSVQARQLDEVRTQVDGLHQRITEMRADHDKVTRELAESWQLVSDLEKERDAAKAQVENVQNDLATASTRLSEAHDALAQRDQRIAVLERLVSEAESQAHTDNAKIASLERQAQQALGSANYWREKATEIENAFADIKVRVSSIFSKGNEPKQVESRPVPQIEATNPEPLEEPKSGVFHSNW